MAFHNSGDSLDRQLTDNPDRPIRNAIKNLAIGVPLTFIGGCNLVKAIGNIDDIMEATSGFEKFYEGAFEFLFASLAVAGVYGGLRVYRGIDSIRKARNPPLPGAVIHTRGGYTDETTTLDGLLGDTVISVDNVGQLGTVGDDNVYLNPVRVRKGSMTESTGRRTPFDLGRLNSAQEQTTYDVLVRATLHGDPVNLRMTTTNRDEARILAEKPKDARLYIRGTVQGGDVIVSEYGSATG